jgi:hypothetical protein
VAFGGPVRGQIVLTFHVLLSLIALIAAVPVMIGLLTSQRFGMWTALFLATSVLTSATGFLLPAPGLLPSHIVGILSLVVLLIAILARYKFPLVGKWRSAYVICAVIAFWFNAFVGVVQAFQKIGPLHVLAPQGSEPAFMIAQLAVLLVLAVIGFIGIRRFDVATR